MSNIIEFNSSTEKSPLVNSNLAERRETVWKDRAVTVGTSVAILAAGVVVVAAAVFAVIVLSPIIGATLAGLAALGAAVAIAGTIAGVAYLGYKLLSGNSNNTQSTIQQNSLQNPQSFPVSPNSEVPAIPAKTPQITLVQPSSQTSSSSSRHPDLSPISSASRESKRAAMDLVQQINQSIDAITPDKDTDIQFVRTQIVNIAAHNPEITDTQLIGLISSFLEKSTTSTETKHGMLSELTSLFSEKPVQLTQSEKNSNEIKSINARIAELDIIAPRIENQRPGVADALAEQRRELEERKTSLLASFRETVNQSEFALIPSLTAPGRNAKSISENVNELLSSLHTTIFGNDNSQVDLHAEFNSIHREIATSLSTATENLKVATQNEKVLKAAVDRNKTRIKELLSQLRQTIGSYASSSQLLPNSSTIISDSTFETNADELKTKRAARRICEGKIQNVQSRAELTTLLQEKNNLDLEIADLKHTAHTILSKQAIRTFTEKATPLLESIELLLTEPNPSEQQIAKLNTLILDAGVLLETLKACQIAHASTKTELTLKKATSNNLIATIDAYLEISSPENLSRVYSALQEKTEISNVKELMERTTGTAFAVGMLNFSATPLEDALRGHLTAIRDNEIQLINRANNGYSDGAEGSVGALHWMLDRHTESITSFETLIRNANATISRIETKKENDTKHYQAILATGEADKALRSSQKNSEIVTEIFTQIESQLNQLLRSATPSNVRWMNFLNAVAEDALANAIPEDQWANLVFNRLDNQFHMLQFPGFKERLTNNINASLRALNSNPTTGVNSEPFTIQLPDVSAPVRSPSPNLDDANLALKAMDELGRTYPSSSSSQVGKENSEKATPSSSNRDAYLSSQPNAVIFQFIEGSRNQLVALAKSSTKDAETTRLKIERRIRAAEAELELRRSESA